MNDKPVFTVAQLNQYIKQRFDSDENLSHILVCGEISNFKAYSSGHLYFSLKDSDCAISCVLFRGNAMRLKFRPDNGMRVIALGSVSYYPRDGKCQFYCDQLMLDGMGAIQIAFDRLKLKLQNEGLFDPEHKKPLPAYPKCIALVTSPSGAAVRDMIRIITNRYPICRVIVVPVLVQGIEAPKEIADAIRFVNAHSLADLIITGRGGGSIEDLWAFNEEIVARAIYASDIPVISAVGHEPDVTISDYVADARASTPSNGAELAVPDKAELMHLIGNAARHLHTAVNDQLQMKKKELHILTESPYLKDPLYYYKTKELTLEQYKKTLNYVISDCMTKQKHRLAQALVGLDALSPSKTLLRGYSIAMRNDTVVSSVEGISTGDRLKITFSDGVVNADVLSVERGETHGSGI